MSETSFFLFHQWIVGLESVLYAVCLALFFRPFMAEKDLRIDTWKRSLVIFLVYIVIYPVCMLPYIFGWIHMLLVLMLLMALSGYLNMERKLIFLLGIIFHCIKSLSMMILRSLDYFTSEYAVRNMDTAESIFLHAAWNYLFIQSAQFLLFSLMLFAVTHRLRKKKMELHIRELIYLLLTPATGILFVQSIVRLLVIADEQQVIQLYEQFPALIGVIPGITLLLYAGLLAAIASCQRIIGYQEEKKKYFVAQQQIAAMQKRIEEMEQFYDGIRRMKHEMRNHLINIKGLAETFCYEDMEKYIAKMDESMNVFELTIQTGNAVTDVIINDRQNSASRQGISFQSEFSFPASAAYNAYDIGIILSNLLQNALEACERITKGPKYICLSGIQKNSFFIIRVRNPFEGEVIFDRYTGLPMTTKEKPSCANRPSLHGIGLSNVRSEAEKYGGSIDIQIEKNEFCVTVLLQENAVERRKNDYQ